MQAYQMTELKAKRQDVLNYAVNCTVFIILIFILLFIIANARNTP